MVKRSKAQEKFWELNMANWASLFSVTFVLFWGCNELAPLWRLLYHSCAFIFLNFLKTGDHTWKLHNFVALRNEIRGRPHGGKNGHLGCWSICLVRWSPYGAPKASPPTIFSNNIDEDVKKKRRRRKKKGEMSTHFWVHGAHGSITVLLSCPPICLYVNYPYISHHLNYSSLILLLN